MRFRNTDSSRRTWPTIQRPDSVTLALDAGEEAELDLPKDFNDPYLKLARVKFTKKPPQSDPPNLADLTTEHPKELSV